MGVDAAGKKTSSGLMMNHVLRNAMAEFDHTHRSIIHRLRSTRGGMGARPAGGRGRTGGFSDPREKAGSTGYTHVLYSDHESAPGMHSSIRFSEFPQSSRAMSMVDLQMPRNIYGGGLQLRTGGPPRSDGRKGRSIFEY